MDDYESSGRYPRAPIGELGGLVKTIKADEAIMIQIEGGILIAAQKLQNSRVRIRIIADKRIPIRFLDHDEVLTLIQSRRGAKT